MRKQKKVILQKIPKNFKLAFGMFVSIEKRFMCKNSPTPIRFGEGQFRDVYGGIIVDGLFDDFMKPDSHIVIKRFKDK